MLLDIYHAIKRVVKKETPKIAQGDTTTETPKRLVGAQIKNRPAISVDTPKEFGYIDQITLAPEPTKTPVRAPSAEEREAALAAYEKEKQAEEKFLREIPVIHSVGTGIGADRQAYLDNKMEEARKRLRELQGEPGATVNARPNATKESDPEIDLFQFDHPNIPPEQRL